MAEEILGSNKTVPSFIALDTEFGTFQAWHVCSQGMSGVGLHTLRTSGSRGPSLLRIHSSCVFSESLHSLDCDCALQLTESLRLVGTHGGVVIYLFEEGRGAGLAMKIRAISLQQNQRVGSREAYQALGLPADCRRNYSFVREELTAVAGPDHEWILLTNNPLKVSLLEAAGIRIAARQPLVCGTDSPIRRRYLSEKQRELGHVLPERLAE